MHDGLGAIQQLVDRLEDIHLPPAPAEDRFYAWHPLPLAEWLAGMAVARQHLLDRHHCWTGEESFLDVGSGIGTKLLLASQLGWGRVEGVERHAPYAETSGHLWADLAITVCEAHDFARYHEFDLVYSYRLCIDLDDQAKLTTRIADAMKPGALLFLAGGPDPDWLTEVGHGVWKV